MTTKKKKADKINTEAEADKERVAVAKTTDGWFDGKKMIPFSQMSDEYLQNAKLYAQRNELYHHNRYTIFSELVLKLDEEAEKRGLVLEDRKTEFHKQERKVKNKIKESKTNAS